MDVRRLAVEYIVGLTATPEQAGFFLTNMSVFDALVKLASNAACQANVFKALVNLSNIPTFLRLMVKRGLVETCIAAICDPNFDEPDTPSMLLANLTHDETGTAWLLEKMAERLPALVDIYCRGKHFNSRGEFHHLASVFHNLTQHAAGRDALFGPGCLIQRLLPFTRFAESEERRAGAMGVVRNCSFDVPRHDQMLGRPVDVLPDVLLPLAGPEEFTEEEMEGMPDDLQYLPPEKRRDPSRTVRKLALETLMQLCATRKHREALRRRGTAAVVKQLQSKEEDSDVQEHCVMVLQLLTSEEDPSLDNLKEYGGPAPSAFETIELPAAPPS